MRLKTLRHISEDGSRQTSSWHSSCGTYCYIQMRTFADFLVPGTLLWVVATPGDADPRSPSMITSICHKHAERMGYRTSAVVSLCALRTADPTVWKRHHDPEGPWNAKLVRNILTKRNSIVTPPGGSLDVVVAWGNHGKWRDLGAKWLDWASDYTDVLLAIGDRLASGQPPSPSRLSGTSELRVYSRG